MFIVDGGAGDDTIEGNGNLQWYYAAPWSVTRTVTEESGAPLYYREYAGVDWEGIAVEQGDDIIYAGSGNDWVFAQGGNDFVDAGIGDDVVFGEGGDKLWGGGGADILLGGAGTDITWRMAA